MTPSLDTFKAIVSSTYTEITIDYDIDCMVDNQKTTINLGAGLTLNFIGGNIKNAILVGNNTVLKGRVALTGTELSGTWFHTGTTRPSGGLLYKGKMFFDETLGKPIWYDGTAWVDATGTTV